MATRAIIQVIGANYAQVYKHWDSNPDSTLPWLTEFAREFSEERGHDPEYCLAQLLRSSVFLGEKYKLDDSHHTGWGVIPFGELCGADWLYKIDSATGTVEVVDLNA